MRVLMSASLLILGLALAPQSLACDRHGGAFGQLSGASWADYDPALAEADSLFLEESLSKWHKENDVPRAVVKPAKPSFSKASTRASLAAQQRLAKKAQPKKQEIKAAASSMKTETLLPKLPSR